MLGLYLIAPCNASYTAYPGIECECISCGNRGAHVWNYVYTGERRVSDYTNHGEWRMEDFDRCAHLDSLSIDPILFENKDIVCGYNEYNLTVHEIEARDEKFFNII